MGQHRKQLFENLVRSGVPGFSHHHLRGNLCGAGTEHPHRGQRPRGNMGHGGLHHFAVFCSFQNGIACQISIPSPLISAGAFSLQLKHSHFSEVKQYG